MACVHNQMKINELNRKINVKQIEISKLNDNITKCGEIKEKHKNFADKIDCVRKNLEENTVVAGKSYDEGKMTKCFDLSYRTIGDCNNIILESENKKKSLEKEIDELRSEISLLQGDCYNCIKDREDD